MNVICFIRFPQLKVKKNDKGSLNLRPVTQNIFSIILDDINLTLKGIRQRRGHLPINLIPEKKDYCIM